MTLLVPLEYSLHQQLSCVAVTTAQSSVDTLVPYTMKLSWQETFADFVDFHVNAKVSCLIFLLLIGLLRKFSGTANDLAFDAEPRKFPATKVSWYTYSMKFCCVHKTGFLRPDKILL